MNAVTLVIIGIILLIVIAISFAVQSAKFKAYDQGFRDGRLDQHLYEQNVHYKTKSR